MEVHLCDRNNAIAMRPPFNNEKAMNADFQSPIRCPVRWMLRRLAFRDRMGAPNWNMARSDGSDSPCQDLSECSRASHRHNQTPRPSTRHGTVRAISTQGPHSSTNSRSRRASQADRRKIISFVAKRADSGLLGLNRSLYALAGKCRVRTFPRFRNSENVEVGPNSH